MDPWCGTPEDNPYRAPSVHCPDEASDEGVQRRTAQRLAVLYHGVLICLVVYLSAALLQFIFPRYRQYLLWLALADAAVAAVLIIGLSIAIYRGLRGLVFGLVTLIPVAGLFLLVLTLRKASLLLRRQRKASSA